jgi:hypothetical protein
MWPRGTLELIFRAVAVTAATDLLTNGSLKPPFGYADLLVGKSAGAHVLQQFTSDLGVVLL